MDNLYIREAELEIKSRKFDKSTDNLVVNENDDKTRTELEDKLKTLIIAKFGEELKTREVKQGSKLELDIKDAIIDYLNSNNIVFEPSSLKKKVVDDFLLGLSGYGVLQPLMDDDGIEDIYIYAPDKIWYLKEGKKYQANIKFENETKLKSFIDNLLSRVSRSVNRANPIEDGRMPDGSRVAVSADVLSPNGYTMSIRKFRKERITLDKMVKYGEFDEQTKSLLIDIINARFNFLVSGGTSSGKTTLLNAMAQYINPMDNVCTIEDNIELQLNREFWLQLETRKANLEGEGEITMQDLLVHLLRRSPDRIIVGEVRTGAVADTLMNAVQTGHDGVCATIHANSAERCRARMCKLASVASDQPYDAALDDFDHSINVIIQLKKDELLGKRVLTSIDWVNVDGTLTNLVSYNSQNYTWRHTKLPLEMYRRIKEYKKGE